MSEHLLNGQDDRASLIDSLVDKSRAGSRISEREKTAVFSLSERFDKRRLGKQQQVLHDLTERCREQEVADMSKSLTSGISLATHSPRNNFRREVSMYLTNTLLRDKEKTPRLGNQPGGYTPKHSNKELKLGLKRSSTGVMNFRPSNVIRMPTGPGPINTMFPKVTRVNYSGLSPTQLYNKTKWLHSQKINGPIQLEHYIHGRQAPCAPLMLPTLQSNHDDHSTDSTPRSLKMKTDLSRRDKNTLVKSLLVTDKASDWTDHINAPANSEKVSFV
ncbi:uncharacterized protein LOC144452987 [Glandiceps talaboti]